MCKDWVRETHLREETGREPARLEEPPERRGREGVWLGALSACVQSKEVSGVLWPQCLPEESRVARDQGLVGISLLRWVLGWEQPLGSVVLFAPMGFFEHSSRGPPSIKLPVAGSLRGTFSGLPQIIAHLSKASGRFKGAATARS